MSAVKPLILTAILLATASTRATAQSLVQANPHLNPPEQPAEAPQIQDDPANPPVKAGRTKGDPLEKVNRRLFKIGIGIDKAVFRPVALNSGKVIPKPLRKGLRNFFRNLMEPLNFVNGLLQLKPKRSLHSFKRFLINSVMGVGGVIDVAHSEGLVYKSNGFGNTLARWGVKPGPYLFLPLVGPTNLRDLLGGAVDANVLPVAVGSPFTKTSYQAVRTVSGVIDQRIENDPAFTALLDGAADPYATFRSVYLQNREAEVRALRGHDDAHSAGSELLEMPLDDPAAPPAEEPSALPEEPKNEPQADQTPAALTGEMPVDQTLTDEAPPDDPAPQSHQAANRPNMAGACHY